MMKKTAIFFCVLLNLCFFSTLHALNDTSDQAERLTHIDKVITNDQGVFLLIGGLWLQTEGIQATPEGIIVLQDNEWVTLELRSNRDNYYVWQCNVCGAWNPQGTTRCWNYKKHDE